MITRLVMVLSLVAWTGCSSSPNGSDAGGFDASSPADDPSAWPIDESVTWVPQLSDPTFVIPSAPIPTETYPNQLSNNNLDLRFFHGRLYFAWRQGPFHFASPLVKLQLISSGDLGKTWRYETTFALGTDAREPRFLVMNDTLHFFFFQAGTDEFSFDPKVQWRTRLQADGTWAPLEQWGDPGEISWDVEVRGGVAYRTSYLGPHYQLDSDAGIAVRLSRSHDGTTWEQLGPDGGSVYQGGVSEVGFEFEEDGGFWGIARNEDGDSSGFGTRICTAPLENLGAWDCGGHSDPLRYDSARMLRHGRDLYLVARRDPVGPYDEGLDAGFADQQLKYLVDYSERPKRSALYQIDTAARKIVWLQDIPGDGDTAYASIVRLDAHRFLIANYTSPLDHPEYTWLQGQTSALGTQIYFVTLTFAPQP